MNARFYIEIKEGSERCEALIVHIPQIGGGHSEEEMIQSEILQQTSEEPPEVRKARISNFLTILNERLAEKIRTASIHV